MQDGQENTTELRALTLLRCVGWLEGVSYLLLLLIAMPLKYAADIPEAVSVVGAIHGFAFVAFIIMVARVSVLPFWSASESVFAMIASLLPAGTIVLDKRWRSMHKRLQARSEQPDQDPATR